VHPTINLVNPDPHCDLDYIAQVDRPFSFQRLLTTASGFFWPARGYDYGISRAGGSGMTRIVITGMGILSPYGVGPDILWENVLAGQTAVKTLTGFETEHLQCRIGGQLTNFSPVIYQSPSRPQD